MWFSAQTQFHPVKFIAVMVLRLDIREHTFVRAMEGNTAMTENGKIHADKVVVATYFPFINKNGAFFSSFIITTLMSSRRDMGSMYVDDSKNGLSFRNHGGLQERHDGVAQFVCGDTSGAGRQGLGGEEAVLNRLLHRLLRPRCQIGPAAAVPEEQAHRVENAVG